MTRSAQFLAAFVLAVVSVVFVGYAGHFSLLITLSPKLQGMSVLTASGIACIALAFLLPRRGGVVLGWVAIVIAIAALISHSIYGRDALSPMLANAFFGLPDEKSGRTSIATAIGIAALALAQHQRLLRRHLVTDLLGSGTMLLSGTALLGYAYRVGDLYALFLFDTMAFHTAVALFALGFATLLVQADRGWARMIASSRAGGGATRRQLAFTFLPPVAGGVLLHSTFVGKVGPGAAMALLVVITIAPLVALILRDGKTLDELDIEREARDRLKQKTADDLIARLAEQASALNHESAERARAEAAMYGAQRLDAVGQLTGGIAHDFNNLLMAIASNLHLTQSRLDERHPARVYVDRAAQVTKRGTKLTAQLLAFSRTQRLDMRAVELDATVQGACELIGNSLGPAIAIELNLATQEAWVVVDADQLHLAILNLALNARDAMPDGGTFSVSTLVDASAGDSDRRVAIVRVSDNGAGIAPEVIDRVVEPFFTTKERGKGTGLGLAQVYGVVRQCGGDMRITSALSQGTTIDLLLPLTTVQPRPESSSESPMLRAVPQRQSPGPLLVIDDDEHVRIALAEMFRSAGYEVIEAESGAEGLGVLDRVRPALAVIDFIMPGLNGAEVGRLARARMPTLPIIFVSGYSDTLALDEIGNATILRKPVGPETLLNAVHDALTTA